MIEKKFKYKKYLEKFPNCPSDDFEEVERDAYRWTHQPVSSSDFIPLNLIMEPPPRMLDDSDRMCMGYGLSMFNTLANSLLRYRKLYSKFRDHQKEQFKQDKGSYVALVNLRMSDGVADFPNEDNYGHFTFHEYAEANMVNRVAELYEIFDKDERTNF